MNEKNPLIFIDHILESISDVNLFIKDQSKEELKDSSFEIKVIGYYSEVQLLE